MLLSLSYLTFALGFIGVLIWAFYGWEDFNDKHEYYESLYFGAALLAFGLSAIFYGVDNYITTGAVNGSIIKFFSTYVIAGCGGFLSFVMIAFLVFVTEEYRHQSIIR